MPTDAHAASFGPLVDCEEASAGAKRGSEDYHKSPISRTYHPYLHDLHWLPIDKRITFKILLLVFKCLNDMAPVYLCDLLSLRSPSRRLRSPDSQVLLVPKFKTETYGRKRFEVAAPVLWNSLPSHVKDATSLCNFKRKLKTHLFSEHYY